MNIIITILLVIAAIIVLMLLLGLFMKKNHYVRCETIINAPVQKVFEFLRFLDNQEKFNKYATRGGERIKEFKGTDGTVGFIYAWKGDKDAGMGEKEILNIIEGKKIETEIRFTKPMAVTASVIYETEAVSPNQTRVSFINAGILKYPLNVLIPMAEKNFAKDMNFSLATLKTLLEK